MPEGHCAGLMTIRLMPNSRFGVIPIAPYELRNMDLEKIELHPLTKLIVYLAVPVFAWVVLSNMYRTFANPISSKQAIQEISDEFKRIELPKDARVIEQSSANKGTQVWVGATYASGLEIKTIESA